MIYLTFDPFAVLLTSHRRRLEVGHRPTLPSHDVALLEVGSARRSFEAALAHGDIVPVGDALADPRCASDRSTISVRIDLQPIAAAANHSGLTKAVGSIGGWQDREARRRGAFFLTRLSPQYPATKATTGEHRASTPSRS